MASDQENVKGQQEHIKVATVPGLLGSLQSLQELGRASVNAWTVLFGKKNKSMEKPLVWTI